MPVIVTSVKTLPKQSIRRYVQPLIVAITMPRISLKKNRDKLDALATALIEKETLGSDEIAAIIEEENN